MALRFFWQDIINSLGRNRSLPCTATYFWPWPHSLGVGWVSVQGTLGLHSLGDSTQSDPVYFLFLCPLFLIWWMGNITFLSQQFLFFSSFPSLKSKFITKAWILKDFSQPSFCSGTAGTALLGKWLEAGSGNWDSWFQFPGQPEFSVGPRRAHLNPLLSSSIKLLVALSVIPKQVVWGRGTRITCM